MWNDISKIWQAAFYEGWNSFKNGSIPIGAVIADENDNIICTGRNRVSEITDGNHRIAHAETDCLLRLDTRKYPDVKNYTIYACMEPCPMCMGALLHCKIGGIVFGAFDERTGSAGSSLNLCELEFFRKPKIIGGYMEEESKKLLRSFFEERR